MNIDIYSRSAELNSELKKIEEVLKKHKIQYKKISSLKAVEGNILVVLGSDNDILATFAGLEKQVPVLAVGESTNFLVEIEPRQFEEAINKIKKDEYWVEERLRIEAKAEGMKFPLALNEIAIVSSRGGGLVRYSLNVDGELVWRDLGDGAIISTPTGSTAYSFSAGGPIIIENASTIGITPICSANHNRPLVIKDESKIVISEVFATSGCEIVIDGQFREKIKGKKIEIKKAEKPALFLRFGKTRYLKLFGKLKKVKETGKLPADAPPSAKFIYKLLDYEGGLTQKEIVEETGLPDRTVRHALSYLLKMNFISKNPTLRDVRQAIYVIKR